MIHGHGGNVYAMARQLGCRPEDIIDMSSNINPLGMPPGLSAHLRDQLHRIAALPEADAARATEHMADLLGVDANRIQAGNGTTQFIYTACPALGSQRVLIVGPTYADYADACRMHRIEADHFLARPEDQFEIDLSLLAKQIDGHDTVLICNPNNPTGHLIGRDPLRRLCEEHPGTHFIIDESYLPFAVNGPSQSMAAIASGNVSVLYSLSKIFGVPGLRAGFLVSGKETVTRFERWMQPWSMNALAQAAVSYLGNHPSAVNDFIEQTSHYLEKEREKFCQGIAAQTKMTPFPSQTSYILIKLPRGVVAEDVCRHMARKHILIRDCHNFHGLSHRFVRVALKTPAVNQRALDALVAAVENPDVSD